MKNYEKLLQYMKKYAIIYYVIHSKRRNHTQYVYTQHHHTQYEYTQLYHTQFCITQHIMLYCVIYVYTVFCYTTLHGGALTRFGLCKNRVRSFANLNRRIACLRDICAGRGFVPLLSALRFVCRFKTVGRSAFRTNFVRVGASAPNPDEDSSPSTSPRG